MYQHRQIGWFVIVFLLVPAVVFGVIGFLTKGSTPDQQVARITYLCTAGLMIFCLTLFFSLTVTIDKEQLLLYFGWGLIKKRLSLVDIESVTVVKNPWYYGFGIHQFRKTWIFNVSGRDAVEIVLKTGKKYRIGTDDLPGIMAVLQKLVSKK